MWLVVSGRKSCPSSGRKEGVLGRTKAGKQGRSSHLTHRTGTDEPIVANDAGLSQREILTFTSRKLANFRNISTPRGVSRYNPHSHCVRSHSQVLGGERSRLFTKIGKNIQFDHKLQVLWKKTQGTVRDLATWAKTRKRWDDEQPDTRYDIERDHPSHVDADVMSRTETEVRLTREMANRQGVCPSVTVGQFLTLNE